MPGVLHLAKLSAEVQPRRRHGEGMAEAWRRQRSVMLCRTYSQCSSACYLGVFSVVSWLWCAASAVSMSTVPQNRLPGRWCLFALSSYLCHASTKLGMSAAGT